MLSVADVRTCAILVCNLVTGVLRPVLSTFSTQTPSTAASGEPTNRFGTVDSRPAHRSTAPPQGDNPGEGLTRERRLLECGKVDVVVCLLALSPHLPPNVLLDRVIPYLLEFTNANGACGEVKGLALEAVTQILYNFTQLPPAERLMPMQFPLAYLTEYLLPKLAYLTNDQKPEVQSALAQCLPKLAKCSSW